MVILGTGLDMARIDRIERSLQRFGDRFTHRIFTEQERQYCRGKARSAECYAKRFAAKEACAKALGTGLRRGVFWRDMRVINQPGGRPELRLFGGAAERLDAMTPPGKRAEIHLSLTDDVPYAMAMVIISVSADS